MINWKKIVLAATFIIVVFISDIIIESIFIDKELNKVDPISFVGSHTCIECHAKEYDLWKTSHHYKSMLYAADSTVLGDFNNSEFSFNGLTHKFYKRNGKFYTYTEGIDGKMTEFEITHTFGYTPLQQYLIPFERGKYQCLPIAWDTEKKEWFHMAAMVYTENDLQPDNWLYWTNQSQNWNGMCAECHSTNLQKNYYHETDSFNTTWSEINVSCEACHGPSSKHNEWAKLTESQRNNDASMGLIAKTGGLNNIEYVESCARCHTRRTQLGDFKDNFDDLLDIMIPSLMMEHYYPDGQILDEDYVVGSFMQSKMYHHDIKCNDCHDVHSGKRLFEGNQLCFQCHKPEYYNTAKHHFHKLEGESDEPYFIGGNKIEVGEGAQCINCHMPAQYFMGIDYRNDHSIRNPRPDLSLKIDVPNACNQCHTDKSVSWAIKHFEKWYGKKERPHYGTVFAGAVQQDPEVEKDLIHLINDELTPIIIRATALSYLSAFRSEETIEVIENMMQSSESQLRLSALRSYTTSNPDQFIKLVGSLLSDPVKAVRIEAAIKFAVVPSDIFPDKYKANYNAALDEFKMQNEYTADFPSGKANLALMYSYLGQNDLAIKFYEQCIKQDSAFIQAYMNLALLYNKEGMNNDAKNLYRTLIKRNPDFPSVHYFLGLLMVEIGNNEEGIKNLLISADKDPENSRINYNLGLLYLKTGSLKEAEEQLKAAIKKTPIFDYEYTLAYFYVITKQFKKGEHYLNALDKKYPNNQNLIQLKGNLN